MICKRLILASWPFSFSHSVSKWNSSNSQLQLLIFTPMEAWRPHLDPDLEFQMPLNTNHIHLNVFKLFKNWIHLLPTYINLSCPSNLPSLSWCPNGFIVNLPHLAILLTFCIWFFFAIKAKSSNLEAVVSAKPKYLLDSPLQNMFSEPLSST